MHDSSNGYDALAAEFIAARAASSIGVATVRRWSRELPRGSTVLDLGCGCGVPISQALIEAGFTVFGVDASPRMTAAFAARFPHAAVTCEPVERSAFFGRTFDAAIAWGLLFLLPAQAQRDLIRKVATALRPEGRFLFTVPWQEAGWTDALTGRPSRSLGEQAYNAALSAAGFDLAGACDDEGGNHYFDAVKRAA